MATISSTSSFSGVEIDPSQRAREIKAKQAANLARAQESRQEFENALASKRAERPVNPSSRIGQNINIKV